MQAGNGPRSTVVSTQMTESVRDNIVTVFGSRTADGLEALEASAGGGLEFKGCSTSHHTSSCIIPRKLV